MLLVVATDRRQARVIFRYIPRPAYVRTRACRHDRARDGRNSRIVQRHFYRGCGCELPFHRGPTLIAALFDEAAFWRNKDLTNPDHEILQAVRPSLATTNGLLFVASSPYAKRGILWSAFRKHYAEAGEVLIWKAETRRMNSTVPQSIIDDAYEADASAAAAEYGAQFRDDLEAYISREAIDAVTLSGVREIPPQPHIRYVGFVDAAGGGGGGDFDDLRGCALRSQGRLHGPRLRPRGQAPV